MRLLAPRLAARRRTRGLQGVNVHPDRLTEITNPQWERMIDIAASAGFAWIRGPIIASARPENAAVEARMRYATTRGLKLVITTGPFDGPNPDQIWSNWWGTPAQIVTAALAYGPALLALEQMNEGDLFGFQLGIADWPARLAARMVTIRDLVPQNVTLLGPSCGDDPAKNTPVTLATAIRALGVQPHTLHTNANLHWYTRGVAPTRALYDACLNWMTPIGNTHAPWVTEYGQSTGPTPPYVVDEATQATLLAQQAAVHRAAGVQQAAIYELQDRETGATDRQRNEGVLRTDLTAKPALTRLMATQGATAPAGPPAVLRGVDIAGSCFGDANPMPGTHGVDYFYDYTGSSPRTSTAGIAYLASHGIRVARIDFRWERIQHTLDGPLDTSEVARLTATLDALHAHGIYAILDMGNFGHRKDLGAAGNGQSGPAIGDAALPTSSYQDAWTRIANQFDAHPAIAAWEIMNEPVAMGATEPDGVARWKTVSQAAVTAIRNTGSTHRILVDGYNWAACQGWVARHGTPWITDPAGNTRYTMHHYWEGGGYGGSGNYAQDEALTTDTHNRVIGHLNQFCTWLSDYGVQGACTEVGWPANDYADDWDALAEEWLDIADTNRLDVSVFATGAAWSQTYPCLTFAATPGDWTAGDQINTVRRQGTRLKQHLTVT